MLRAKALASSSLAPGTSMTNQAPQALHKTVVTLYVQICFNVLALLLLAIISIFGFFMTILHHFHSDDVFTLAVLTIVMFCLTVWTIFALIVVIQLKKQKSWAWVCALVIAGFSCFSFPSMIFGIIELVGLLDQTTINWFKIHEQS